MSTASATDSPLDLPDTISPETRAYLEHHVRPLQEVLGAAVTAAIRENAENPLEVVTANLLAQLPPDATVREEVIDGLRGEVVRLRMRVADLEAAAGAASAAHAPASAHGAGEWSAARWFDTLGATEAVTRSVLPPGTTDELQAIRSLASDSDLNAELLRRLIGGLPALAKTLKAAITELAARESATAEAVQDDRPPHFGPDALLDSVKSGAIAPLRGRWIVELHRSGGRLKRRQDLPAEAFFTAAELVELVAKLGDDYGLLFVALSYRCAVRRPPPSATFDSVRICSYTGG